MFDCALPPTRSENIRENFSALTIAISLVSGKHSCDCASNFGHRKLLRINLQNPDAVDAAIASPPSYSHLLESRLPEASVGKTARNHRANALVSFKVLFQCKKYQGSFSVMQVRDFRGAMMGRADKGIIITTGSFTAEARKEAVRYGVPPIELVDGEKLIVMLEQTRVGFEATYDLRNRFRVF
jgi:hypothetical protein